MVTPPFGPYLFMIFYKGYSREKNVTFKSCITKVSKLGYIRHQSLEKFKSLKKGE